MNELFLAKEIYSLKDIEKACRDYKDLAEIRVVTLEDRYQLLFEQCRYPVELTMQEFENYLIDIMGKYDGNRIY